MYRDLVFVSGPVGNPAESHGTSLDLVVGAVEKKPPGNPEGLSHRMFVKSTQRGTTLSA